MQMLGIGKNRDHSELLFDILPYGAAALQKKAFNDRELRIKITANSQLNPTLPIKRAKSRQKIQATENERKFDLV